LARGSLWSGASRSLRPAQHEEIAELEKTDAQPLALVAREVRERAREDRDLVSLEAHEDLALGRIPRGCEERRGGNAEGLSETREDRGARLFDPASLELGDRAARYADLVSKLTLREVKTLAIRAHQASERGSG
jgi:hypothetical protein